MGEGDTGNSTKIVDPALISEETWISPPFPGPGRVEPRPPGAESLG